MASRRQGKQPYCIAPTEGQPFAFAGLWERWERDGQVLESGTILVTQANALIASIHDRTPVILDPAAEARWLDPPSPTRRLCARCGFRAPRAVATVAGEPGGEPARRRGAGPDGAGDAPGGLTRRLYPARTTGTSSQRVV